MNQTVNIDAITIEHVNAALESLRRGSGVLVTDNSDRENEGDLIFSAEHLTVPQMAQLIRECSGIVCLCLTEDRINLLNLPMMTDNNTSRFGTGFTVTIEAAEGVTTGVSAADRVTTIKAAISPSYKEGDLCTPGHVFPLRARTNGVLERDGHTEATVDLMKLAGLQPYGVLCEVTNADGTMARRPEIESMSQRTGYPIVTLEEIIYVRQLNSNL